MPAQQTSKHGDELLAEGGQAMIVRGSGRRVGKRGWTGVGQEQAARVSRCDMTGWCCSAKEQQRRRDVSQFRGDSGGGKGGGKATQGCLGAGMLWRPRPRGCGDGGNGNDARLGLEKTKEWDQLRGRRASGVPKKKGPQRVGGVVGQYTQRDGACEELVEEPEAFRIRVELSADSCG